MTKASTLFHVIHTGSTVRYDYTDNTQKLGCLHCGFAEASQGNVRKQQEHRIRFAEEHILVKHPSLYAPCPNCTVYYKKGSLASHKNNKTCQKNKRNLESEALGLIKMSWNHKQEIDSFFDDKSKELLKHVQWDCHEDIKFIKEQTALAVEELKIRLGIRYKIFFNKVEEVYTPSLKFLLDKYRNKNAKYEILEYSFATKEQREIIIAMLDLGSDL